MTHIVGEKKKKNSRIEWNPEFLRVDGEGFQKKGNIKKK